MHGYLLRKSCIRALVHSVAKMVCRFVPTIELCVGGLVAALRQLQMAGIIEFLYVQ